MNLSEIGRDAEYVFECVYECVAVFMDIYVVCVVPHSQLWQLPSDTSSAPDPKEPYIAFSPRNGRCRSRGAPWHSRYSVGLRVVRARVPVRKVRGPGFEARWRLMLMSPGGYGYAWWQAASPESPVGYGYA